MDHRLPLMALIGVLAACSSPDVKDGSSHTSGSTLTSTPHYEFELDVDGTVTPVVALYLGLIEAEGPGCQTSWTLNAHNGASLPAALMLSLRSSNPIVEGSEGPAGALAGDGQLGTVNLLEYGGITTSYSSPRWEVTTLGVDALQVRLEPGTACPFEVRPGDDDSECPSFQSFVLTLVGGEATFNPSAGYCREDTLTDDGEECFGSGLALYDEERAPEPCTVPSAG